jgi:hypothetical protein
VYYAPRLKQGLASFRILRDFLLVRPALCWLGQIIVGHHYDFPKTPNVVTQASSYAGSDSQRLVDSGEIVMQARPVQKENRDVLRVRRRPNQVIQVGGWIFTSI